MTDRRSVHSASPYEKMFGFCRARRIGDRIEVAGTAPIGEDGHSVAVGDPTAQARRCFEIIAEALEELGGSLADVVRTRMFLTHADDWKAIGEVHGEIFGGLEIPPVATMVEVSGLIDHRWRVEIEAEAVLTESS